jgi:quercetin dioxygenase-like cupin family protein
VAELISVEDLRSSETASRFEGGRFGSTVSFFLTRHPPGSGVALHRHPYEETFIVEGGNGTFSVDGESIEAEAGQIVIVPAGAVHGFTSDGPDILRVVGIHPAEWIEQEQVED